MKFYKVTCGDDVEYKKLYKELESIGNFIIDNGMILFYAKKVKKANLINIGVAIEEIDPLKQKTGSKLSDEWLVENYRKFRVEDLLRKAEIEKQEELYNLYNIIKEAGNIIEREEDLIEGKE